MNRRTTFFCFLSIAAGSWGPAWGRAKPLTNSLGMKMVLIRPDQYLTGTRLTRANWPWYERDEIPRWINVGDPFHMAVHEVTNAQYRVFVRATGRQPPRGMLLRGLELVRDFEPWKDGMKLTAGATIRTRANDSVSLTFMRNIQVQLGKTDQSELILEGAARDGQGQAFLLGLKKGDVWIQIW